MCISHVNPNLKFYEILNIACLCNAEFNYSVCAETDA